jgi:hypothetical protein
MHYGGGEREGVDKMGRQICAFMLRGGYGEYIKLVMFENLAEEFPKLAHDFFWAARNDNDGKFWCRGSMGGDQTKKSTGSSDNVSTTHTGRFLSL